LDLIILKAFYSYSVNNTNECQETLALIEDLDFDDKTESEEFYKLLAFSPYRKLMILEAF